MLGEQAYQNALRRRDDLQREINQRRAEVEQIDHFLKLCEHFAGIAKSVVATGDPTAQPSLMAAGGTSFRNKPRRRPTTASGMALLPHIRMAILEAGTPLRRGAIVQALEERGVRVGGKGKPASNVGTVMWRGSNAPDSPFVGLKMGYWPRDVACPAAAYEPEMAAGTAADREPEQEIEEDAIEAARSQESDAIGDELDHRWERAAQGA